jgi:hypothetical protein
MDWFEQVDNYCERTDTGFWSEPVNAATNAAFLLAALVVWAILGGRSDIWARLLVAILAAIGVGSFLFHTLATRWAMLADVIPITLFIVVYLHAATVRFWRLPWWAGLLAVAAFFPYAALVSTGISAVTGPLNGSVGYAPVAILIAAYGLALLPRDRDTGRNLLFGAGILILSLTFRTLDSAVCPAVPFGTHFLWHLLNAVMLGWMILTLHHHAGARR